MRLASCVLACVCGVSASAHGDVTVKPTMLDFGSVVAGEQSAFQMMTLTNSGPSPIKVLQLALAGDVSAFVLDDQAGGFPLANGQSRSFGVACQPVKSGAIFGQLYITIDGFQNPIRVDLSCAGLLPSVQVVGQPAVLDLGDAVVGQASPPLKVTLGVPQDTALPASIHSIYVDATPFTVDQSATKKDLNPGDETSFAIVFKPAAVGPVKGTLSVVLTNRFAPPLLVPVAGRGVAPQVGSDTDGGAGAPPPAGAGGCSVGGVPAAEGTMYCLGMFALAALCCRRRSVPRTVLRNLLVSAIPLAAASCSSDRLPSDSVDMEGLTDLPPAADRASAPDLGCPPAIPWVGGACDAVIYVDGGLPPSPTSLADCRSLCGNSHVWTCETHDDHCGVYLHCSICMAGR